MAHRRPIFALTLALIALWFGPTPSAAQSLGQWSPVAPLPFFPVHSHLLPTGKVMIWPGSGVPGNDPRSWDPATGSTSILSKPGYDQFCSGHTLLGDGTLFVAGGHITDGVGLKRASIYNPVTDAWSAPPLPDMNAGRWYPTTTVLGNGDVLVVSGETDLTIGINTLPQVFQRSTGTWRSLTNAQLAQDIYPWMLLAPNGKVFDSGPTVTTRYLDTSGTGVWTFVANHVFNGHRGYGSAVMYAPGKVLVMGGNGNPTNTAEVIDLNAASPSWRAVGSMEFARRQLNATLLPDGKVLVTGGTAASGFNEPSGAVHEAELWDPVTEDWTTLASSSGIPRIYHSSALLLADGRVFSTGGNGYPNNEIYSPPYLFNGARPTISSAPQSVAYGQTFFVGTPNTISKVTMLRLSSVTHAFNQGQYINQVSFSQTTGGLNVTAPPHGNVAPPGYYMLFILNGSGVPSLARFVRLGGAAAPDTTPPTVSLTAPASGATIPGTTVTVSATAADNVGVAGVQFKRDGANLGAEDTTAPYSVSWNTSTATNGAHTLTALARDVAGNSTTSAGVSVTVSNAVSCPQTSLNVSAAFSDTGFAYIIAGSFGTPADNANFPTQSTLRLFEGSLELGPAHSAHANIRTLGQGRFSHWSSTTGTGEVLRFAASDNTDPRTNGRSYTYCVPGAAPDTTPPTVSLTAPASGATVSGTTVAVSATASDTVGVAGVQFKLDGANLGVEDTAAPYSVTWNTTTATNASHTLTAVARDAAGNTTTSVGVTVTVNNADTTPPTVSMTAPANGATVSGTTVAVSATAADAVGVAGVQFKLDGGNLGVEDTVAPYSVTWNTTTATNGAHTLTAVARDAAGNTTTSAGVAVTVSNDTTPPTVSLTAPASGATVSGTTVAVSATAADNVGVAGVQFKLDGANLGVEDTATPYSVTWNSTTATNGAHTLTAVARDAAGNSTTSAGRSVTVSNAVSCPQTALNVSTTASSDGGFAYIIVGSFGTPADNANFPTQSTLRLFEGSLELGPAHSLHANIRNPGQGRFSHWSSTTGTGEALRFSASDSSNPKINGRSYTYCVP